jgi:hypothetical protein
MEVPVRTKGIPFSETGDEEQNKVKGLNYFWWPVEDVTRVTDHSCILQAATEFILA